MKKIFFLILSFCLMANIVSADIDWRSLHESADLISSAEALKHVTMEPDNAEAQYVLGVVALKEFQTELAKQAFTKVSQLIPESVLGKWGLAEVYRRERQGEKAEAMLVEILNQDPQYAPAYLSLAYIYYLKLNFKKSAQLALTVIRFGRSRVDLNNLIRAYGLYAGSKGLMAYNGGITAKMRHGTMILSNLRKAESLNPNSYVPMYGLGAYYLLAPSFLGRDLNKAEKYLNKAIELEPKFPETYVRLAQVYQLKGDEGKFKEYIEKALAIDPQNELAIDIRDHKCNFICVK